VDQDRAAAVVPIPDIRDYAQINAELVRRLDAGHTRVLLPGAEGQRLLAAGLSGGWSAVVEIEGIAGPELAAELDAPGLVIVCRGSAADGAGRALHAGRLVITGSAGDAVSYHQSGGSVMVRGPAGHRAGLALSGGTLVLLGSVGRLLGERQTGGRILAYNDRVGPHAGHARHGGRLTLLTAREPTDPNDQRLIQEVIEHLGQRHQPQPTDD
jgi:methylamine---glutamate N-methyltransferase subunit B